MKILLVGGGTMGSVSPLIAVYQKIKQQQPETEFLFVGTKTGPERAAVESYKIPFQAISSGKLRRYFSWQNFSDPFRILAGLIRSFFLILRFRPNAIMIAGSFVGVPVAYNAWLLRVPVLIHQQDIVAGLANKLMGNTAQKITVSFDISFKDFFPKKTVLTGNPVRAEFYDCQPAKSRKFFGLKEDLPVVLIFGGGTGSQKINETVKKSLPELLQFCQVIHVTGRGKTISVKADDYHQFEFLTNEFTDAQCAADIIVNRAGMSTLSELVILAKPTILIPLPGHQEDNASYFQKNNAVITLSEANLNNEIFTSTIKELVFNSGRKNNLSRNMAKMMKTKGAEEVARLLLEIAK
ncbi:MAG: UDP-N-acetylglucosamine--N-acetylmuramyl-(pentapeptide) pyrophosphoryl-undecaprenol N-acetylglucosamine transferase [Patescibacteria group bacterium]